MIGAGCVDGLHALVVRHHHEARGGNAAIGAVDHGRVGAVGLLRRRRDGRRGIAARERDQLLGLQLEVIGLLERRQRRGRIDELGGGRQHHLAAAWRSSCRNRDRVTSLLASATSLRSGDGPGVVGGRRRSSQTILLASKSSFLAIA